MTRRAAWLGGLTLAIAVAAALAVPPAGAQSREFVGRIDSVSGNSITVESRGDKMRFRSSKSTSVSGQGKSDWKSLQRGDRVSVSWDMTDEKPTARRVVVMPSRD